MAVTERWSERRSWQEMVGTSLVWRAQIVYQVTDAATERDAKAAIRFRLGSDHDVFGGEMKVTSLEAEKRGPAGYWYVRVGFGSDAPGTGGTINTRPRIRWSEAVVTEEVDRTYEGHPITNSVGDPPVTPLTRDFDDLVLTYARWEPQFSLRQSIAFRRTINQDNFTLWQQQGGGFTGSRGPRPLTVFGGECMCVSIAPTGDYEEGQSPVQIAYTFHFRERIKLSGSTWASGFDWRFMDQGTRGYYVPLSPFEANVKRIGSLYLRSDMEATEPVRFDGYGKPLDSRIRVTADMNLPSGFNTLPAGASIDDRFKSSDPGAVFLFYKKYPRKTFRGLVPLFR